ncbi:uncharacterized protein LOC124769062 [Schistocerca piceifrons]|uniref:uncharacterized protein LOC124769062 n=1 Tax=Schistocerca piceifrons TaxID=274613 RepID=UPI001F5F8A32|nr:uncharacterized protein LOC124769062 [Schistocerca piceifrons]
MSWARPEFRGSLSRAMGVADRRSAEHARSTAPSGPPHTTTGDVGVADRRPEELAPPAAPSDPPPRTTRPPSTDYDLDDGSSEDDIVVHGALPADERARRMTAITQQRPAGERRKRSCTTAASGAKKTPKKRRQLAVSTNGGRRRALPDDSGAGATWTTVTSKRAARPRKTPTPPPTSTANRFGALAVETTTEQPTPERSAPTAAAKAGCSNDEDDEGAVPTTGRSHRRPPPIVFEVAEDYKGFLQLVRQWTTADFTLRAAAGNLVRLQVANTDDYIKVTSEASNQGLHWFTHAAVPERLLKIVFKGLPMAAQPELLREELTDLDFSVRNVTRVKSHVSHKESPSLLVIATDTPENRRLYQVTRVANTKVTVENLKQKRGLTPAANAATTVPTEGGNKSWRTRVRKRARERSPDDQRAYHGKARKEDHQTTGSERRGNAPAASRHPAATSQGAATSALEGGLAAAISALSAAIDKRRRRRRRRQRPAAAASRGGTVEPARGGNAAGTTAAPGGDSTAATAHVRPPPPAACGKGGGGRRRRDAASGKTATTAGPDIESALQEAEARFRMVLHAEMEAACLTLRESLSRNTNKKEAQHQDDRMAATAAQPSRDQATQTAWPKKMTISRAAQASLKGKGEAVERQDSSVQTKEFVNHRAELVDSERLDDASPRDVYQMSFLQSRELRRRKEEALNEQSRRQREEQEAERDRRREAATARRERQRQHWQHGK